mmetsp:Transcript_6763/g.16843  ORF Transcript_6763/g.16843 Transcript_6763/m.16843 type:complete len:299 (-) Transcript_6763:1334-2230(-)
MVPQDRGRVWPHTGSGVRAHVPTGRGQQGGVQPAGDDQLLPLHAAHVPAVAGGVHHQPGARVCVHPLHALLLRGRLRLHVLPEDQVGHLVGAHVHGHDRPGHWHLVCAGGVRDLPDAGAVQRRGAHHGAAGPQRHVRRRGPGPVLVHPARLGQDRRAVRGRTLPTRLVQKLHRVPDPHHHQELEAARVAARVRHGHPVCHWLAAVPGVCGRGRAGRAHRLDPAVEGAAHVGHHQVRVHAPRAHHRAALQGGAEPVHHDAAPGEGPALALQLQAARTRSGIAGGGRVPAGARVPAGRGR